jgi:hypothetical protein
MKDGELEVDQATGRTYTRLAGIRVEIADAEQCERATFVVCGPVSNFQDDVHTLCALCGAGIVHRPYAPKTPPKICLTCAIRRGES